LNLASWKTAEAARARRLAGLMLPHDRLRLESHAVRLEQEAADLQRQAAKPSGSDIDVP
jgi:hypothetical protein